MDKKERKHYQLELTLRCDDKVVTYELTVSFDLTDNVEDSMNNKEINK